MLEERGIGEEKHIVGGNRKRRELYWRWKKREKKGILEEEKEREERDIGVGNRERRDGYWRRK